MEKMIREELTESKIAEIIEEHDALRKAQEQPKKVSEQQNRNSEDAQK